MIGISFNANANPKEYFFGCLSDIESATGIDKKILMAIKIVESGYHLKPVISKNKNSTVDIGVMQINSLWLPELTKHGIDSELLLDNCINLRVAAWILYRHYQRSRDIWSAVGSYHSRSPKKHQAYLKKVYTAYHRLSTLR